MDSMIFQVPGYITKFESMAHSWKIHVETQEGRPAEEITRLIDLKDKLGWFTFAVRQIEAQDLLDLPALKAEEDGERSPAQRMRSVLYRLWEKDDENIKDFELYYRIKMDRFINHLKEKLA